MRIPTGDGFVDGSAAAGNTGNGVLTNITRDGSDSWNGQSFSIRFTAADQYEVLDGAGNVTGTGTYKAGDNVEVNGVRLQITGAPLPVTASTSSRPAAATSSTPWTS
jgi:flagellar hook-associated protein 3 FlgL